MKHDKRFILVISLLIISMIAIHTTRAPQKITKEMRIACIPLDTAKKLDTNTALKWDAQVVYDTTEQDNQTSSYRCYISFPKEDVVCAPKKVANRKDLQNCPAFPSLASAHRNCYFLNKKHHALAQKLSQQSPRLSLQDLQGTIAKTVPEAKKILMKK